MPVQLATTMDTLQSALGAAQQQAAHLDFRPLASQLRSAAARLRQSANGSAQTIMPIASRLEAAAGDLLQVLPPSCTPRQLLRSVSLGQNLAQYQSLHVLEQPCIRPYCAVRSPVLLRYQSVAIPLSCGQHASGTQAASSANPAQIAAAREHLTSLTTKVPQLGEGATELAKAPEGAPEQNGAALEARAVQEAVQPGVEEADKVASKLQQVCLSREDCQL